MIKLTDIIIDCIPISGIFTGAFRGWENINNEFERVHRKEINFKEGVLNGAKYWGYQAATGLVSLGLTLAGVYALCR